MNDTHNAYDHGWRADHRRQAAPASASHSTYDFRPEPEPKPLRKRDVALAALIPLGLAALFFAPWAVRTLLHLVAQ